MGLICTGLFDSDAGLVTAGDRALQSESGAKQLTKKISKYTSNAILFIPISKQFLISKQFRSSFRYLSSVDVFFVIF